jgi:spermidine/putrescine transport system ATP-binding protein
MSYPYVVSLKGVSKRYSETVLSVDAIDMDIAHGEFISLLGPSGCGKTTTLRMIAGFEQPSAGRVLIDGQDLTEAPPYGRPVNTVFQDYALFPHLNVSDNVGFGLSLTKVPAPQARKRIADMLELVGLADKARARIHELSGGQPRVLLLDEPLSALDAHLRQHMQVELKRLQSSLGTTFVMVTHDQTEALAISDRIAVMHKGRIEQIASPDVLYDSPESAFVAGFIGASNLLQGQVLHSSGDQATVGVGALQLVARTRGPLASGSAVTVSVRPEDLRLQPPGAGVSAQNTGRVLQRLFQGRALRLQISLPGIDRLTLEVSRESAAGQALYPGDEIALHIQPGAACAFAAPESP